MAQVLDVALRRDLLARWCMLAEQRLQHLTDLFESGRWRRYYSEPAFLENFREAKKAVETWRALSGQPVDGSDDTETLPRQEREFKAESEADIRPLWRTSAPPTEIPDAETDPAPVEQERPRQPSVDLVALEQALAAPLPADLSTLEQRYPLLRNSLF